MPCARSWAITTEVFASCIRARTPSCIRAPPEADTMMSGIRLSAERCASRAIFSPTTEPIEPPMNRKSITAMWTGTPSSFAWPVRIASWRLAFLIAAASRSL
jgi:hypothetical protein